MHDDAIGLVRVAGARGRVTVIGEERDDVAVEGRATVDREADRVTVSTEVGRLVVRVPAGTDVVVGTTSGRINVEGSVGAVCAVSDSGRIEIDSAASADVRTTTGGIDVGRVGGACCIRTDSGRVTVDACGGVDAASRSGRVVLGEVDGAARAHSVSGKIEMQLVGPHDVYAETVSGRVSVSLPTGTRFARVDAPGAEVPAGVDCTVVARSGSGRVSVSTQ